MKKKLKNFKVLLGVAAFLFLLLSFVSILYVTYEKKKDIKYIAYIGIYRKEPSSESIRAFDFLCEKLLRKKVKELNKDLEYNHLELKTFECNYDPKKSKSIYEQISLDDEIALVIDGSWGSLIRASASVIKKNRIPIIGINPNKEGKDFGDSVLFLRTEGDVPAYLSAFASTKECLDFDEAYFVYESGYKLKNDFDAAFLNYKVNISDQFEVIRTKADAQDPNIVFSKLLDTYKKNKEKKRILFICTHDKWGDKIIDFIENKKKLNNFIMMGPDSITKDVFSGKFGVNTNNEVILYKTPEDAAPKHIYNDIEYFERKYPDLSKKLDKTVSVKGCNDAISIIKTMLKKQEEPEKLEKKHFSKYFRTLRNRTIRGEHDIYSFDHNLVLKDDWHFVSYKKGKISSYPLQLNDKKEIIPNLIFGLEIQSIYDINLNSNSFFADFYYWIKFGSNATEGEKYCQPQNISKSILFQNMKQGESSIKLVKEKIYNEIIYRLFKVSGKFFGNFHPQNYPFDSQEINITAKILEPVHRMKISFDNESFKKNRYKHNEISLNEWSLVKNYVTVDMTITEKVRGEPDALKGELKKYKNIAFRFLVKRKFWGPFLQVVLPILIIGFLSIALLYVPNPTFERLGSAHIGIFFSIIAFSIALAELTPNSDAMTKTSLLFLLVLSIVFINFLVLIVLNYFKTKEEIKKIELRPFRISITALYFILVSLIIIF